MKIVRSGGLVWGLIALFATAGSGQTNPLTPPASETAAAQTAVASGDSTQVNLEGDASQLVFEREVFAYPEFRRRNPFSSLVGTNTAGPRFESMSLSGIIYLSTAPAQSIALMQAPGGDEGTMRSEQLRTGDRWGNVRVVEVRQTEVVLAVEEFGLSEQRILQLPTRGQGGS